MRKCCLFEILLITRLLTQVRCQVAQVPLELSVYSQVLRRECLSPGIIDVKIFTDHRLTEVSGFMGNQSDCMCATVLQNLHANVSYGDPFRRSRINVVYIHDLSAFMVQRIGNFIKRVIRYDWSAKFLFMLPLVSNHDLDRMSSIATALTFQRLSNNVFVVNNQHIFTFNILNSLVLQHEQLDSAIDHLYSDKFKQMYQYHLDDIIDVQLFPYHLVIYGRFAFQTREAIFISMFVDRLNITMVDREDLTNQVDPRQFGRVLKTNSIVATFGHTPGDFRRVFTNEMEGICAMNAGSNKTSFIEAFMDPFDRYIWITWLVTSELMLMVWMLIRWKHQTISTIKHLVQDYVGLHFHLIRFLILSPPNLRKANRLEKLLTFCYLVAVFHIVTLYVSIVTSNLSTTRYGKVIDSIQKLIDLQIPIGGLDSTLETLNASHSRFNLNGHGPNGFLAHACSYGRVESQLSPNQVHIIREPLLYHYIVFLLHKESILQETLEKYVALSYQADLYRYWDNFIPVKSLKPKERPELTANVIAFEELMWQFIILPFGGLLGAVAFLLELGWHKIELRWHKIRENSSSNLFKRVGKCPNS